MSLHQVTIICSILMVCVTIDGAVPSRRAASERDDVIGKRTRRRGCHVWTQNLSCACVRRSMIASRARTRDAHAC